MPYTLKTQQISVKDPDSGDYIGVDVLTEQTKEGLIAELQTEGNTQVARINQAAVDVQSAVDQAETEAQQLISSTQSSLNTFETQKDTIAQTIASMAELGTDTALTTAGMAADAKKTGDEISNVKNAIDELDNAINTKADKQPGKNLFNPIRTEGTLSGVAPSSARVFAADKYYVGLTSDGYYVPGNVSECSVSGGAITVRSRNSGYGVAFPMRCEPNTQYILSYDVSDATYINAGIGCYDKNGEILGYRAASVPFTTFPNSYWMVLVLGTVAAATSAVTFTNVQIEKGNKATTYSDYMLYDGVAVYQGLDKSGSLLGVDDNGNVVCEDGLKSDVDQMYESGQLGIHFFYGDYKVGGFYNGKYYGIANYPTRVANVDFLQFDKEIQVDSSDGIQFVVYYYSAKSESSYTSASPWSTTLRIPKDTIFRIMMRKNPEVTVTDITEYRNAVEWGFYDPSTSDSILTRNADVLTAAEASCWYGIHDGGVLNAKKKLSILVTTDVHYGIDRLNSAMLYGNTMPFIDMGVCLGDMAAQYYSDTDGAWYTNIVNDSDKPFYTILGNHDGGNGTAAAQNATVAQSFAKWIQPTLTTMGMPSLTTPYYYLANTTYKVGMVFLNSYDVPDTTDSGGNFVVSRGAEVISQTQVDWLLNVLDNIPSDYTLVVFSHSFPYENVGQAGNWTQAGVNLIGNGSACYTDIIPDIINAWKTGGSLTKTYAPTLPTVSESVTVNHDFSARGTGLFAAYIVGHGHRDVVAHSQTYPDQLAIGLCATCSDTWQNGAADLPRVSGAKSEDAITLVGIVPGYKRINLVRIGSNVTNLMADRTMICLQYGT